MEITVTKGGNKVRFPQEARFVKAAHVARILGLTPNTIRSAIRRGDLEGLRIGAHYLVSRDALEGLTGRFAHHAPAVPTEPLP
ncbi:MAG: DNA-binding protein [Gemmatimonadetes bacterium]|nr:DNA-binding protein [Gemmatimonadota bacterium]